MRKRTSHNVHIDVSTQRGGGDRPPKKSYASNFFHQDFAQFGEEHSRLLGHFDVPCFVLTVL